jgi:hypothetical protein
MVLLMKLNFVLALAVMSPFTVNAGSVVCPSRAASYGTAPTAAHQAFRIDLLSGNPVLEISSSSQKTRFGYKREAGYLVAFSHDSKFYIPRVRIDSISESVTIGRGVLSDDQAPFTRTDCTFEK